ncbi:hypothetical protein COEREDRAFT_12026 [Coemansia reversa NRRL 1564]|uniref:ATP-dependent DNA helicase n=1 Tax=Coemansia reversa (strain ATCC 12441 / NRRL 1564) TaxID=763665 RepID=A0A2G5B1K6_COERN|nr:hypothetical protein COEREDRAFT_12026 [Coemansia reversa NRRL 1564]|eukprot:PIA12892.1 hypothetical protein COEREDRAFT_12026 [Coemansia reversa NRRL 1564]
MTCANSFAKLCHVNGQEHHTFQGAAQALGLLVEQYAKALAADFVQWMINAEAVNMALCVIVDHIENADEPGLCCNVVTGTDWAELLSETSLIVWDKLPMANKAVVKAVENMQRELCGINQLFGNGIGDDTSGQEVALPLLAQTAAIASAIDFVYPNTIIGRC